MMSNIMRNHLELAERVGALEEIMARVDALVAMETGLSGRLKRIEESLGLHDNAQTAIALSEGAVHGTVHLLAEMADCKDLHDKEIDKLVSDLKLLKSKINELITYVKNTNQ